MYKVVLVEQIGRAQSIQQNGPSVELVRFQDLLQIHGPFMRFRGVQNQNLTFGLQIICETEKITGLLAEHRHYELLRSV